MQFPPKEPCRTPTFRHILGIRQLQVPEKLTAIRRDIHIIRHRVKPFYLILNAMDF